MIKVISQVFLKCRSKKLLSLSRKCCQSHWKFSIIFCSLYQGYIRVPRLLLFIYLITLTYARFWLNQWVNRMNAICCSSFWLQTFCYWLECVKYTKLLCISMLKKARPNGDWSEKTRLSFLFQSRTATFVLENSQLWNVLFLPGHKTSLNTDHPPSAKYTVRTIYVCLSWSRLYIHVCI